PALHGAHHRERDRRHSAQPGGGRLQPRCRSVAHVSPRAVAAGAARHRRRRHPVLYSGHECLCHAGAAWRAAVQDDGAAGVRTVPLEQLAVRCRRGLRPDDGDAAADGGGEHPEPAAIAAQPRRRSPVNGDLAMTQIGEKDTSGKKIVICGAGIAGIAAAYYLAVDGGYEDIVILEAASPLALTSDKSTEAYRNWWPGPDPAMTGFINRSIDLIEAIARASCN